MAKNKRKKKNNIKGVFLIFIILILILVIFINNKNKSHKSDNSANPTAVQTANNSEEKAEQAKPSRVQNLTEEEIKLSQERGLPVLMYHFFYDAEAGETGNDNNFMEIHDFEEQIKYLAENDYYVPTWDEVLGYINGKNGLPLKSVVITVDDGAESFFRLAVPVLEKYHYTATSFLITSWYDIPTENYKIVDFQSHSHDMHKPGSDGKGAFLTISYEDACKDLETCRAELGENCKVFCYPFGHYNDRCKQILKDCNYILAFTTKGGRVYPGSDPLQLPRVRMSKGDSLNAFVSKIK